MRAYAARGPFLGTVPRAVAAVAGMVCGERAVRTGRACVTRARYRARRTGIGRKDVLALPAAPRTVAAQVFGAAESAARQVLGHPARPSALASVGSRAGSTALPTAADNCAQHHHRGRLLAAARETISRQGSLRTERTPLSLGAAEYVVSMRIRGVAAWGPLAQPSHSMPSPSRRPASHSCRRPARRVRSVDRVKRSA
jgi:hypothetical protein